MLISMGNADCRCRRANAVLLRWESRTLSNERMDGIGIVPNAIPGRGNEQVEQWNKIEHRLFNHISMNWQGQPLVSLDVMIERTVPTIEVESLLR